MKTALLLIDIQNDYFDGGKNPLVGSSQAVQNAQCLLSLFREKQMPVVHIQHVSTRPDASFFLVGTNGASIHSLVEPLVNEVVVEKHFPNSFRETNLLEVLKQNDVTNLVISGMMTHMCVDATVRAAKDFGFECVLVSDACATKNLEIDGYIVAAESVHCSFLAALSYYYATVLPVEKCLALLKA